MDKQHPDAKLIEALGDTTAVAKLCEVQPPSVSEWKRNGIPKARRQYLRLLKPEVFAQVEFDRVRAAPATDLDEAA